MGIVFTQITEMLNQPAEGTENYRILQLLENYDAEGQIVETWQPVWRFEKRPTLDNLDYLFNAHWNERVSNDQLLLMVHGDVLETGDFSNDVFLFEVINEVDDGPYLELVELD